MIRITISAALLAAIASAQAAPATDAQKADFQAKVADLAPRGLSAGEIIGLLSWRYGRQFTLLTNRDGTIDVRVQDGDGNAITYFETVAVLPAGTVEYRP